MKKYLNRQLISGLLIALALVSCDRYLDVQPKGVRLLATVEDYDLWLDNTFLASSVPNQIHLLEDNVDKPTIATPTILSNDLVYLWAPQYAIESAAQPLIWKDLYQSIYYFNTVLEGIDEAVGDETMRKQLKAEALLGRALNYFYLVNLYGKVYNASTADQDLAVPFVTAVDLTTPTPKRNTVQEIYDHIFADIEAAIPNLPQDNSENRFRGSVAGGYSVLARVYLYMGNYAKAAQNAQLALDHGQDDVQDYATMANSSEVGNIMTRPGAIYARLSTTNGYNTYPTLEFLQRYDSGDLRLDFYHRNLGDYSFQARGTTQFTPSGAAFSSIFPNWGTSVAEMRLILAEGAVRAQNLPEALVQLDALRKKRFRSEDYVKFESDNPEAVLQRILLERSFELSYRGLRWLDMRRLDAEGLMPEVNRYDGAGNVIATLSPGSEKYTLQIPMQVLYFNPDWPQNPWD